MQAIETMTPQQRECLALLHQAIVQYGTHEGNDAYRSAHEACQDIPFSDKPTEFDALYNELLKLWRAFTPQPRGQYKIRHMEVGYSSFSYSQWVQDKEQTAPCKEEIVSKADALMEASV